MNLCKITESRIGTMKQIEDEGEDEDRFDERSWRNAKPA